jgi:hypothetical protein
MSTTIAINQRPMGKLDAQGRVIPDSFADLAFQGDYTGTDLIYKGFARPGSGTTAAVWQIAKMTYDMSHNLLTITWPEDANGNASTEFIFQWSQRASYTYA